MVHALVHAGLVDVRHHYGYLQLPGEEQGQLPGHQPGADHTDFRDWPCQRWVRSAIGVPGTPLKQIQECVHGGFELRGENQPCQGLDFQFRRIHLVQVSTSVEQVQHLHRSWRGTGRLGVHDGAALEDSGLLVGAVVGGFLPAPGP